jgi:hypothetical protein
MTDQPEPPYDLQNAIIMRELARRPDLAFLGRILQNLLPTTDSVTEQPSPIFIRLAKELIDNKQKRDMFVIALETVMK